MIRALILAAVLFCLPLIFTVVQYKYAITILVFICIYVIATSGLDMLYGYCGQISMGHVAYFAIGAYGSVLLHNYTNIPVIATMLIAAAVAAAVGAVIAYPASKLVFHFLSLATIAFAEIVYCFLQNSPNGITGNAVGLFTETVSFFGLKLSSSTQFYYFAVVLTVLMILAKVSLSRTKTGRAFIAIRENPTAANGMGINVTKYKVIAFAFSAFYTGLSGAMYAHFVKYIGPETFVMKQSVMFLTMLLFGGTASVVGPIIGVSTVMVLNECLRFLEQYQLLVYGILLLIVIVALPGGLWGCIKDVVKKCRNKNKRGKADVLRNQ